MADLTMYERCLAGMEREYERIVGDTVASCSWAGEVVVDLIRQMWAWHFEMMYGGARVDKEALARIYQALAQWAEVAGDEQWWWTFGRAYAWACADIRGEECR